MIDGGAGDGLPVLAVCQAHPRWALSIWVGKGVDGGRNGCVSGFDAGASSTSGVGRWLHSTACRRARRVGLSAHCGGLISDRPLCWANQGVSGARSELVNKQDGD